MTRRTLLLLRHGKSDWTVQHDDDRQRPLNPRGRRAALTIGRFLAAAGPLPDLAIASPAERARRTLELAASAGAWNRPVAVAEEIYSESVEGLLEHWLPGFDDSLRRVLLVGHQPTFSELLRRLVGGGDFRFPTAALARIDLPLESWAEPAAGRGELRWLVTPKILQRWEEAP
ncbi:MAG: histidine phosphatase family protein [Acidobacteriota bacterium]